MIIAGFNGSSEELDHPPDLVDAQDDLHGDYDVVLDCPLPYLKLVCLLRAIPV